MTSEARHVCVVGGGVIGLSCAAHLAELGCSVTVLEQGQLASGSSALSVGVYTRQYVDAFEIQMRMNAFDELCVLEREAGLHIRRIGYLRLARDEQTLAAFEVGLETQRELGLDDGILLDSRGVAEVVPSMKVDDLAGGMLGRTDGYLDGHQLCMVYAEKAESLGVDIRTQSPLIGADMGTGGSHRLVTPAGDVACDAVVNAAGSWADRVGEILGAPSPTIPQRHQACVIHTGAPLRYTVPEVMDYVPGSGEEGLYFRHERADALIAGLHTNDLLAGTIDDPDHPKRSVDPEYVETLADKLTERLPGLETLSFQTGWSGLYPMSPDGQIVVGPYAHDDSIVAACGMGGIGVHLSPTVGRLVAEYLVDDRAPFLSGADRLSPDRFVTGAR